MGTANLAIVYQAQLQQRFKKVFLNSFCAEEIYLYLLVKFKNKR